MDHPSDQLTDQPWWHSRRNRWAVIYIAATVIVGSAQWIFEFRGYLVPVLIGVFAFGLDWLWFRFFDSQYPEHDLRGSNPENGYAGPPQVSVPQEAMAGIVGAIAIIGTIVLLIWLL